MRRWVCPRCQAGTNGPERPRKDDVRRWCLTCSAETGRLVERTSPALERKRAAGAARSATKQRTKAERERQTRFAAVSAPVTDRDKPVRIDNLLEEVWRLPTRKLEAPHYKVAPSLKVQRSEKPYTTGHCWYGADYLTVTIGRVDFADALGVVIHEAAHEIAYRTGRARYVRGKSGPRGGKGHGTLFRSIFRSLVSEWSGVQASTEATNKYDFHEAMVSHLRHHPREEQ